MSDAEQIQYFMQQLAISTGKELRLENCNADISLITGPDFSYQIYIYLTGATERIKETAHPTHNIHLDIDQLARDEQKIIDRIRTLAGQGKRIYARNTVAARIDKRISMAFQEEFHLQDAMPGKYRYGLFADGELISIAVFSGGRRMHDKPEDYRSFELIRFCHKQPYIVIGGISKLIRAFQQDFNPGDIMTYTDLDWAQESSLERIGFEKRNTIPAQKYWITDQKRYFLSEKTEDLIMSTYPAGYLKYNNGSAKLVLTL
ncbi:hypothetical protein ACR79S_17400 [Sphingobacterium spiritivorum]|uniref:hypothetical protein n=1 Tax=Sphingobacterium spiritivorum TaxID=258 RepID=UPI003DA4AB1B